MWINHFNRKSSKYFIHHACCFVGERCNNIDNIRHPKLESTQHPNEPDLLKLYHQPHEANGVAPNRIAQPEDWPTRYTPPIINETAPHILWRSKVRISA
jgi:hypothetical protein